MKELIQIFASRFINHTGAYYQQWANEELYGYKAIYQAPTMEIITNHLRGYITIALPALDENNNGRWICFDADDESGALDKLGSFLHQWRWHTILEGRRTGRDGHLWIMFTCPIAGEHLVNLGNAMLRLAGVKDSGIELFPKQAQASKLASSVRLPLGIHRKPAADNVRGWFDIPERNIQAQLTWLINEPLNDAEDAITLAELHKPVVLPPSPVISRYINNNSQRINILDFVQARRIGKELVTQCPVCAAEGHDRHRDNLRITQDGEKFCCWYGGAAKVHKARDIIEALKLTGNTRRLAAF